MGRSRSRSHSCGCSRSLSRNQKKNNCEKIIDKRFIYKRIPKVLEDELSNLPVINLSQADFDTGTYRLRKPAYLKLTENINFNPTSNRPDRPPLGWFAAIGVETNRFVIDLNGFEIRESTEYLNQHIANVFAIIELDNSPYIGDVNGVGFAVGGQATYPGETRFRSAQVGWIKNGTLGQSGHWGIHGQRNDKIFIESLRIHDFEVAGIQLNSTTILSLNQVDISGIEHVIRIRALNTSVLVAQSILQRLIAAGVPNAATFLANLRTWASQNSALLQEPISIPENATYGIVIKPGSQTNDPFPLNPTTVERSIQFSNGRISKNISLNNVFIHDIVGAPSEVPTIGSALTPGIPFNFGSIGVFGNLRWVDLFDATGAFNPNPLARALAFNALALLSIPSTTPPRLGGTPFPANTRAVLTAIVSGNSPLFFANALPVFGIGLNNSFFQAGVFGIRIDAAENVEYGENIVIEGIRNLAPASLDVSDLPGAAQLSPSFVPNRNSGNDAWGISMAVTNKVHLEEVSTLNISSVTGHAFGIDFIQDNYNTCVEKIRIERIIGYSINPTSNIDPFAQATGLRFRNQSQTGIQQMQQLGFDMQFKGDGNQFGNFVNEAKISYIIAPRDPQAYEIVNASVKLGKISVDHIIATSSP